jgi:methionine--tRNA ligase beta chain
VIKLSNVMEKKEAHHYVGKVVHDQKQPASSAPTNTAASTPATATPNGGADHKKKDDKKADKKGGSEKKDDKKADKKTDNKKGGGKPAMPAATAAAGSVGVYARLDIRAGKIVEAAKHPNADKLYVEQIDVGEPKPRTIVSGLVEHIPLNEFKGSSVLVICNLKPAEMRGQMSYGMVLASSNDNRKTVELVLPPAGTPCGERVGLAGEPSTLTTVPDKEVDLFQPGNAWIDAKEFLTTDAQSGAMYNGKAMVVKGGQCRGKKSPNGKIS